MKKAIAHFLNTKSRFIGYEKTKSIYEFWHNRITNKVEDVLPKVYDQHGDEVTNYYDLFNPKSNELVLKGMDEFYQAFNQVETDECVYSDNEPEERTKAFERITLNFSNNKTLAQTMQESFNYYSAIDPNSFEVINYEVIGSERIPYFRHIQSINVIDRNYSFGILSDLTFMHTYEALTKSGQKRKKNVFEYYYIGGYNKLVHYEDAHSVIPDDDGVRIDANWFNEDERLLTVALSGIWVLYENVYFPDNPAMNDNITNFAYSNGFAKSAHEPDEQKDVFIYESTLYKGKDGLKDIIRFKFKRDQQIGENGLSKRAEYVQACTAEYYEQDKAVQCSGVGDKDCPSCKGVGFNTILNTEANEVAYFPVKSFENLTPLSDLVFSMPIPSDAITLTRESYTEENDKWLNSLFNDKQSKGRLKGVNSGGNIPATATQVLLQEVPQQNAGLSKYYSAFGVNYTFVLKVIGSILGINPINITHIFPTPNDFQIETIEALINLYNNVPIPVAKDHIGGKIVKKLCNNPDDVKKFKTMQMFSPFKVYSVNEMSTMAFTLPDDSLKKLNYLYYDEIITDLFSEVYLFEGVNVQFWQLPKDQQKEIYNKELMEYKETNE